MAASVGRVGLYEQEPEHARVQAALAVRNATFLIEALELASTPAATEAAPYTAPTVSRLLDLQAAANASEWTIRSLEVPLHDAEAIRVELKLDSPPVTSFGEFGTVDRIALIAVPDWEPKTT